jgi:AhpD family alkylhydroperoxidase
MTQRLNYAHIASGGYEGIGGLHVYLNQSGLPQFLIDLVYLRRSQINRCAYCIDMHSRDLIKGGLTVQKLLLVPVWREAGSLFNEKEKAALAWAETVTNSLRRPSPNRNLMMPGCISPRRNSRT